MTVSHRNRYNNYYNDKTAYHQPPGSILPVLVDVNSGVGNEDPEYSHEGYLYCDGRELKIRDYPILYQAVLNTYGGSTQYQPAQPASDGGLRKLFWINDKAFLNFYRDAGVNATLKMPYPYGASVRIVGQTTSFTGNIAAGSPDITAIPALDINKMAVGETVELMSNNGTVTLPVNSTVLSKDEANFTITLSNAFGGSGAQASAQFGIGVGFGSIGPGVFDFNTYYTTKEPTETVTGQVGANEFCYEIATWPTGIDPATLPQNTVDFTTGVMPNLRVFKSFRLEDAPYNVGNFFLPDYRERIVAGYGSVDGLGSPTIENSLQNVVGQIGGSWYIAQNQLIDGGVFFDVGNVKTTGYSGIQADISSYVTGTVTTTIGPVEDHIFSRPVEHYHNILSSEPDETLAAEFGGVPADQYAALYAKSRSNIIPFEPSGAGGIALGHSHGLSGSPLNDGKMATYGNTAGIGSTDGGDPPQWYVTSAPSFTITSITYSIPDDECTVATAEPHGYSAGDWITITGATPAEYNGSFQILADGLTSSGFKYDPTSASQPNPPATSPAGGTPTVKLAAGTFEDVASIPAPRAYTIDNQTIVGGKATTIIIPGSGVTFQDDELLAPGTITMNPVPASTGEVTQIEINLIAPGGGGATSDDDGTDAGYAYAIFTVDGTTYEVRVNGGDGGQKGSDGGAGGQGGVIALPAGLDQEDWFTYSSSPGTAGQTGGTQGTSQSETNGGGDVEGPFKLPSSGGDGRASSFTTTTDLGSQTFTANTTWNNPGTLPGEVSREIYVSVSGAGGGNGNPNANSGCQAGSTQPPGSTNNPSDGSAIGGTATNGALVTATLIAAPSSIGIEIGQPGEAGENIRDGYANGTGYESDSGGASSIGGSGPAFGGNSGLGAWGNGATGGAGGGASGVYFNGGNVFIGAGGGGGGGGSGGGYNGGGTTDGCYAGGDGEGAGTNLHALTSAMDFVNGANGTQGGCTAGGGGGGGGGCGPNGAANGGEGGTAGVGHNGNGGGSGGQRGDSAYRSDIVTATWSGNGAGPGQVGYVIIDATATVLQWGNNGGGGGQGASANLTIAGKNIAVTVGLQSPGQGGGNAEDGANGVVEIRYAGAEGGGSTPGEPSVPAGRYYLCDQAGVPSGAAYSGNIWISSTNDDMVKTTPGPGSTATDKFALPAGAGAPTYGGLVTRYLPWIGDSSENNLREYLVGPLDMSNVNKIRFHVTKGNNSNGGAIPEEDLMVYWKTTDGNTTTLLNTIVAASSTGNDWDAYDILIPEENSIKQNGIQLMLRQTRPAGQDDNATMTEDNYGLSMMTLFYDEVTTQVFTPSDGSTVGGIDTVSRTISPTDASMIAGDGKFTMSSSTPITTAVTAVPENNIPLITRYHRVKYLIKAI